VCPQHPCPTQHSSAQPWHRSMAHNTPAPYTTALHSPGGGRWPHQWGQTPMSPYVCGDTPQHSNRGPSTLSRTILHSRKLTRVIPAVRQHIPCRAHAPLGGPGGQSGCPGPCLPRELQAAHKSDEHWPRVSVERAHFWQWPIRPLGGSLTTPACAEPSLGPS
jgi:hypothetical protein